MTTEIIYIGLGFVAGAGCTALYLIHVFTKLHKKIKKLEFDIKKRTVVSAITTPIVQEFAKEVCKRLLGNRT